MASQLLKENANGSRLSRLLVNKGTEALRETFDKLVAPHTLTKVLLSKQQKLNDLKDKRKVIHQSQWNLLFPPPPCQPDSQSFDVTLLTVLLRNICGLTMPASGWNALPPETDSSIAANIVRIKFYRNEVYAHVTTTRITDEEFENLWLKISKVLHDLGIPIVEMDALKEAPLSPEEAEYILELKEWYKREAMITEMSLQTSRDVKEMLAKVEKIGQRYVERENVLKIENLCRLDFSWITSLQNKFLQGTREWLFERLDSWFPTKNSDSNVMILTAGPGVGKSVFSAEVCRRYAKQSQLAASHFCQYQKSDSRNPCKILESLASNMCDNVTGFKGKLSDQLKRNHSKLTLSDTFRVLVSDPLYALGKCEPMLLVVDALDESEFEGKSEFLELIAEEFTKLPSWLKVLITSRPELPVKEELQDLNPLHITPGDRDNNKDLLSYLRNSLSIICNDDALLKSLALKCEGSFLYAYHAKLSLLKAKKQLTKDTILELVPDGISRFYKKQFAHLKIEFNRLGRSEVQLQRFLEILVAALGPLPISLLPECLGMPVDTAYSLRKAIIDIASSILPVYDDCVTVYHKSLHDWLTSNGYREHAFTVDPQNGEQYLWAVCLKVFNQIISATALTNVKPSPLTKYAVTYGISHMIESGVKDTYHLSVHAKLVHAMITSCFSSFDKMKKCMMEKEWKQIRFNTPLSNLSSELLQDLDWHLTLFQVFAEDYITSPSFYLQSLANRMDCVSERRSLARSLLKQGGFLWFEDLYATELTNRSFKSIHLRARATCIRISPNEQLVAIGYEDGWVSIFQVPDFQEIHLFDTVTEPKNRGVLFACGFSRSGNRLVTCHGSKEIRLWDVKSQNLLARLQGGGPVDSCYFSDCGLIIVASNERPENCGMDGKDVFTTWSALTWQRIDRRSICSLH